MHASVLRCTSSPQRRGPDVPIPQATGPRQACQACQPCHAMVQSPLGFLFEASLIVQSAWYLQRHGVFIFS